MPCWLRRYADPNREPPRFSMSRSMSSQMLVRKPPGSTSATWMPSPATSIRSASVTASSACFAPWYQPVSGDVTRPMIDEMLTMRPRPALRMSGSTRRARRMGAITIVSINCRASSSVTSSIAPVMPYPALLTSPYKSVPISSSTASHASASVTSRSTVSTSTPAWAAARRTVSALSSERTDPTDR
jgi:hypothetical protein